MTHFRKDNAMADMLSRARFDDEGGMVSEDEEVGMDFFEAAYVTTEGTGTLALNDFDESKYDGEWLQIGGFLRTMTPDSSWAKDEANRIRMVDLVTMPMGVGQMRYLVLAREDLMNQVEGRALQNKTTTVVCRFLIEDVVVKKTVQRWNRTPRHGKRLFTHVRAK